MLGLTRLSVFPLLPALSCHHFFRSYLKLINGFYYVGDGFLFITSDCECWIASATHPALRAPLSERGWRGSGLDVRSYGAIICRKTDCVAIPSRRGVPEGRGVSHSKIQIANGQTLCVALENQNSKWTDFVCRTIRTFFNAIKTCFCLKFEQFLKNSYKTN